jgi:hypothetical protein
MICDNTKIRNSLNRLCIVFSGIIVLRTAERVGHTSTLSVVIDQNFKAITEQAQQSGIVGQIVSDAHDIGLSLVGGNRYWRLLHWEALLLLVK